MADDGAAGKSTPAQGFILFCKGDVRLCSGTADCTPKPKKGRALLAILAAEQRPLTRTKIIDLLWSERQEEQARASLRTLLADLKEQYGNRFDELMMVDRERIALAGSVRTDLLEPTLATSGGELFESLDHIDPQLDDWLRAERERWSHQRAHAAFATQPPTTNEVSPAARPVAKRMAIGVLILAAGLLALWEGFGPGVSNDTRADRRVAQARVLLSRGSPATAEQARQLLIPVVQANPNDADALATLAEATMASADHPGIGGALPLATARREARAYSSRAISLNRRLASAWAALGFSYYATAQGVKPLEIAVQLDPDTAKYRWQLARALEYQNRYDEAYLHTRRAMELDPRGAEPVIGFMRAAVELGRVDEMRAKAAAYRNSGATASDVQFVEGFLAYSMDDDPTCARKLEPLVVRGDYRPFSALVFCLTSMGEKRRAAALSGATRSFRSDILRDDANAVERRAREMGREFWLRNFESLAAADLLLRAGKIQTLVQSFDASYDSIAEFEREGGRVAMEPNSLLLAMQLAGRRADAQQLREVLAKRGRGQRDGMADGTWSIFAKAGVALADGQRARAVSFLEQCFPECMVGYFNVDISQSAYFGRLKGEPRFDRLVERYRAIVNARRKRAGLEPLPLT